MPKINETGIYQLKNGNWGYRYGVVVNGKTVWRKISKDEEGNAIKTKSQASRLRQQMIQEEKKATETNERNEILERKTVQEVYMEYSEKGRSGKAYTTIKKQDSLWNNHICKRFGQRYIDELTVAEINDYLAELYYTEDRAYKYVESFLKMFYLLFGQAYSRDYLEMDLYYKLCKNKETKIHMPKMKIDEETDIKVFTDEEMQKLDEYFAGTNAETAYLLGKYCGLRINECYGLTWDNIDLKQGTILINKQMQYQDGVIKLVSLKTRNAKRTIYMPEKLREYFQQLKWQHSKAETELKVQRMQNEKNIIDVDDTHRSSLHLVNCLVNGKIQTVNSMKYHKQKIKKLLNIEFKYHWLRHTYATRLANMNTPVFVLCKQMGHASSNVTQKYYIGNSKEGVLTLQDNLNKL